MAGEDSKRGEDAFAETIGPSTEAPTIPQRGGHAPSTIAGHDATIAATDSDGPRLIPGVNLHPLPEVAAEHYRTDREIASGGMGRIVAAEDLRLRRPVALKQLLDPSLDQMPRFQREALITARLQHPGIVPVYEAGRWPTGEPFFAMKLVSGRPLDRVIADATTLEARLALLPRITAACDAMAYAHSQRIIHRDLKPSNVLLGDFGETVVIDWGLAKDLDAEDGLDTGNRPPARPSTKKIAAATSTGSTLTIAGAVMGTPAYMAPEQARGENVDQRADVFALGAMIYHVLAGVPPYDWRTATEVIESAAAGKVVPLREREPRTPRDLVAIVERAMAQSPADRYPHAGQLAEELRRFLTGQLVDAHRYTALQRVGRFVRRHRAAVTVSAIAVATIAVGGTVAVTRIVHARDHAEHEGRIANTRKVAAERLIDYMFTHVRTQLASIGRLDLLSGLGNEVKRYYDTLSKIPGGMPHEDELRMAEAIELVGEAELRSGKADLALDTFTSERDKLLRVVGTDTTARTKHLRRMIAKLDFDLGTIDQERGHVDAAIASLDAARLAWDALGIEDPTAREVLLGAADTHDRLGDLYRTKGLLDRAFEEYSQAKAEREKATSQGNGKVTDEMIALSTSHSKIGSIYQLRGESPAALDEYKSAVRIRESLLAGQPDNIELQKLVVEVQRELADLQYKLGDADASIASYRQALPVTEALVRRDPANTEWSRLRSAILLDLGSALLDTGAFKDGLDTIALATDSLKDLVARDPKSTSFKLDLSRLYMRTGDGLVDLGKLDDGIAQYQLALDVRKDLLATETTSVQFRRSVAWSEDKLGHAAFHKGDLARATEALQRALAIRQQLIVEAAAQSDFKNELASNEIELGRMMLARDPKRADELVRQGVARARAVSDADPANIEWKETLVRGLVSDAAVAKAAGDASRVEAELTEALALAQPAAEHAKQNVQWPGLIGEIDVALADLAASRGDPKAAATAAKAAVTVLEPLAKAGRLPAPRLPLLDRARAGR